MTRGPLQKPSGGGGGKGRLPLFQSCPVAPPPRPDLPSDEAAFSCGFGAPAAPLRDFHGRLYWMWRIPRVETGLPTASRPRCQVPLENTWAPRNSVPEPGRCRAALCPAPHRPSWRPLSSLPPPPAGIAPTFPAAAPPERQISEAGKSRSRRSRERPPPLAAPRSPPRQAHPGGSVVGEGRRTPLLRDLLAAPSTRPLLCAGSLGSPSPAGLTTRASPPPRPAASAGRARQGSPSPAPQRLGSVLLLVSPERPQAPGGQAVIHGHGSHAETEPRLRVTSAGISCASIPVAGGRAGVVCPEPRIKSGACAEIQAPFEWLDCELGYLSRFPSRRSSSVSAVHQRLAVREQRCADPALSLHRSLFVPGLPQPLKAPSMGAFPPLPSRSAAAAWPAFAPPPSKDLLSLEPAPSLSSRVAPETERTSLLAEVPESSCLVPVL